MKILYAEPSFSSISVLANSVPIMLRKLGHSVVVVSTGLLPRGANAKNEDLWFAWAENNYFKIRWNADIIDFDLFFSRRGDKIPLLAVDFLREKGVKTVNWEMEDPYPDMRRDILNKFFAPTYWEKTRYYNLVVGGSTSVKPWIPFAVYDEEIFYERDVKKDVNIGFVGDTKSPIRKAWLEKFIPLGLKILPENTPWGNYNNFVARCKIIINNHQSSTLNGRVFEAPAAGTMLVTDYVPALDVCFEIGKEIVVYEDDGVEEAKYYLEHDEEREKIGRAGLERTKKDHRLVDRIGEIIRLTGETNDEVMWKKMRKHSSIWDNIIDGAVG